jgi:ABC-2 type transport system ATP-binding protein
MACSSENAVGRGRVHTLRVRSATLAAEGPWSRAVDPIEPFGHTPSSRRFANRDDEPVVGTKVSSGTALYGGMVVAKECSVAVIRLSKLSKSYGSHRALTEIDFEIEQGEVFGYLGPNGAGKTTTIRIVLGLLRPSSGCAEVFGMDAWRDSVQIHAQTGYVPGEPGFWGRLTGVETLTYLARLRDDLKEVARGHEIATRLDLDLGRPVQALSRGNKQKLAVVQAFMGDPELLVLDEPTSGLDPLVQHEFHTMVREVTQRGGTVLLSSHLLDDVQRTADRVGIIRGGRVAAVERLEELRAKAVHHVTARFSGPFDVRALGDIPGIRDLSVDAGGVDCRVPQASLDAIVKTLARFGVEDVSITEADLEEMFLAYYSERQADAA